MSDVLIVIRFITLIGMFYCFGVLSRRNNKNSRRNNKNVNKVPHAFDCGNTKETAMKFLSDYRNEKIATDVDALVRAIVIIITSEIKDSKKDGKKDVRSDS